ncbi:MAG: response regulator [Proteobacteria bacterium]|nr:response regulator [Pseudomonadota bacterium]
MKLLLVEDDAMLGEATADGLRQDGHVVDWVHDGESACTALRVGDYDGVLLDLGLPHAGGFAVLRWMRARGMTTMVIVVTARDLIADRIKGLDAGADDYLIKPFDLDELSARLRAVQRRANARHQDQVHLGDIAIDLTLRQVRRAGAPVDLTAREFALLEVLAQVPGRIVPRATLEERLYGFADEVSSNTVEVFIHHLRRKLGEQRIVNVRGQGYRIETG